MSTVQFLIKFNCSSKSLVKCYALNAEIVCMYSLPLRGKWSPLKQFESLWVAVDTSYNKNYTTSIIKIIYVCRLGFFLFSKFNQLGFMTNTYLSKPPAYKLWLRISILRYISLFRCLSVLSPESLAIHAPFFFSWMRFPHANLRFKSQYTWK